MTGSTWVDIIVIGIALLAAASGYRSGAVASASMSCWRIHSSDVRIVSVTSPQRSASSRSDRS